VTYGGDSGNRIFVLYWMCPLIRVSVIRGSTVVASTPVFWDTMLHLCMICFYDILKERGVSELWEFITQ
jgi:hypothetical protein